MKGRREIGPFPDLIVLEVDPSVLVPVAASFVLAPPILIMVGISPSPIVANEKARELGWIV
jgi:hypothetical protein